jgi:hypothetical protein
MEEAGLHVIGFEGVTNSGVGGQFMIDENSLFVSCISEVLHQSTLNAFQKPDVVVVGFAWQKSDA